MERISDRVKKGPEKAPHRSLWKALGLTDEELTRPLIGVVSAQSDCVPGHNHLKNIAQAVKDGIPPAPLPRGTLPQAVVRKTVAGSPFQMRPCAAK